MAAAAAAAREQAAELECALGNLQSEHDSQLEAVRAEYEARLKQCESDHSEAMEQAEETIINLEMQNANLESKVNKRESRPEDLDRIKKLMEQVAAMELEVEKVNAEMKFFKLELVNREENFNSVFGAQPRVGVMDQGAGSSKKSSSKQNSARSRGSRVEDSTKFPTLGPTSTSAPSGPRANRGAPAGRRGSVGNQ